MATCNKGYAVKAVLFIAIFFVIYNLMSNHSDTKMHNKFYFTHVSSILANSLKGNATSILTSNSTNNVYTLLYNTDNTSVKSVIFNSTPAIFNHSYSVLLVDSTDFRRKFPSLDQNFLEQNKHSNNSSNFLNSVMTTLGLNTCPQVPPLLEGPIDANITVESLELIEQRFSSKLMPGGRYHPKECNARDRVAIIVPFRDRYAHLPIFLKNMHPFLMKQQIDYGIFVIEQTEGKPFNRAALMNIGFLEALKLYKWDCFIFHDVDLLPLDDRNLYTCPDQPRHMSVAIDILGFKLPYINLFGGVSAMTTKQFKQVNGFANSFWGWGGEDDDMSNRLRHAGFHISRYPINIARYMMLNHKKEKANPKRFENLANGAKKFFTDGLNSIKYEIYSTKAFPLYSWFLVDIKDSEHS